MPKTVTPCTIPGCDRQAQFGIRTEPLCSMHYFRQRRGSPSADIAAPVRKPGKPEERLTFWAPKPVMVALKKRAKQLKQSASSLAGEIIARALAV